MSRIPFFSLLLLAATALIGCNQIIHKPTKQIKVPESGPAILTSAEQAAQPQPVTQQPPGFISRASYMRPINEGAALKPFDEWTEQDAAVDALGRIGAAAVPPLVKSLSDGDPAVRLKAVEVLGRMGEDAQGAVPDLVHLLNDPDADVRKAASRTLGRIGPAAQAAVPALMEKLFAPQQP